MICFIQTNSKHLWTIVLLLLLMMVMPAFAKTNTPATKGIKSNKPIINNQKTIGAAPTKRILPVNLKFKGDINISVNRIQAGKSLKTSATVTNSGGKRSGRYTVKFYIAKDVKCKSNATLLKSIPGSLLSPKAFKKLKTTLTIPDNQKSGSWKIVAKIEQLGKKSVKDSRAKHLIVYTKRAMQSKKGVRKSGGSPMPRRTLDNPLQDTDDQPPLATASGDDSDSRGMRNPLRSAEDLGPLEQARSDISSQGIRDVQSTQAGRPRIEGDIRTIEGILRVGEEILIKGLGFGSNTGQVVVYFRGDTFFNRYQLTVNLWHSNLIRARIPDSFQDIVGFEGRGCQLMVLPHGAEIGPTTYLGIYPDLDRLTPKITRFPTTITRGQIITLEGENLTIPDESMYGEPQIEIYQYGSRLLWHGELLSAEPELLTFFIHEEADQIHEGTVIVKIMNEAGLQTQFTMTYIPELGTQIITDTKSYLSNYHISGTATSKCIYRDKRYRNYTAFSGLRLINGWKVVDIEVEQTICACDDAPTVRERRRSRCSVEITRAPRMGSDNPETEVKIWFRPNFVEFDVKATIEGPAGLPYR